MDYNNILMLNNYFILLNVRLKSYSSSYLSFSFQRGEKVTYTPKYNDEIIIKLSSFRTQWRRDLYLSGVERQKIKFLLFFFFIKTYKIHYLAGSWYGGCHTISVANVNFLDPFRAWRGRE